MKWNIPNALTSMRIVLIPVFLWRFLTAREQGEFYAAAAVLAVSALTDAMDGYIARRFHMITQLGKILDPIADKLTLAAVVVALWLTRPGLWPLYALFILKEVAMLCGGLFLHHRHGEIQGAKWFGKLSTVMFYVVMITIAARPGLTDGAILRMLLVLLAFMLFSLAGYGLLFHGLVKSEKRG